MRLLLLRISCFHLARVSAWFFTAVSMNCSSYWGTRWCHIIKPKTYSDRRYIQLVMVVAIYVAVQCCVCTHCTVSLYLAVNELSALLWACTWTGCQSPWSSQKWCSDWCLEPFWHVLTAFQCALLIFVAYSAGWQILYILKMQCYMYIEGGFISLWNK